MCQRQRRVHFRLRESGVDAADVLIAATSMDEVNMVCCLTAKKMGTSYTIARIRNQEYTSGLAELKRDLGIDMVINPENATAVEISRLLRFPSAANIETFCRKINTSFLLNEELPLPVIIIRYPSRQISKELSCTPITKCPPSILAIATHMR